MNDLFDNLVIGYYKLKKEFHKWLNTICYSTLFYILIAAVLFILMKTCGLFIELDSKSMFTMAIGLITYINVIISFWNSKSSSNKKNSSFYLGRNIETYRIHENKWIQFLNNSPLKLFMIVVSICPALIMLAEVFNNSHIFINYSKNKLISWLDSKVTWFVNCIENNADDIRRIWMSVFVFTAFICVAALIEIVILYRISFIRNKIKPQNTLTKISIENNVRDVSYRSTEILFSLLSTYYFITDSSGYINQMEITIRNHFEEGVRVCSDKGEYHRFLDLSFSGEESALDDLLAKVTKKHQNGKNIQHSITMIHDYFWIKWGIIFLTPNIPMLILIKLAKRDLSFLTELDTLLSSDEHYIQTFWDYYYGINNHVIISGDFKCNINVAKIVEVLSYKFMEQELNLNKEFELDYSFNASIESNIRSMFVLLDNLDKLKTINGEAMCILHSRSPLEYVLEPLISHVSKLSEESFVRNRICRELKLRTDNILYKNALSQLQAQIQ